MSPIRRATCRGVPEQGHATSHVKRHGTQARVRSACLEIVDDLMEKFVRWSRAGRHQISSRHERAVQAAADGGMARDDAIAFARGAPRTERWRKRGMWSTSLRSLGSMPRSQRRLSIARCLTTDARMLASGQVTAANEKRLRLPGQKLAAAKGGRRRRRPGASC